MKFKLFISILFFITLKISFAAGQADMKNILRTMEKDNPEKYQSVVNLFISSAKADDMKTMIEITSDITKNKMGLEALTNYFKNDAIPAIKACKSISKGGDIIHINKEQTGTGAGWVYRKTCQYGENKSIRFQFVVLNENGRIALTSFSTAP